MWWRSEAPTPSALVCCLPRCSGSPSGTRFFGLFPAPILAFGSCFFSLCLSHCLQSLRLRRDLSSVCRWSVHLRLLDSRRSLHMHTFRESRVLQSRHLHVALYSRDCVHCMHRDQVQPQFQEHRDVRRQSCRWSDLLLCDFHRDVRMLLSSPVFVSRGRSQVSLSPELLSALALLNFRSFSSAPSGTGCRFASPCPASLPELALADASWRLPLAATCRTCPLQSRPLHSGHCHLKHSLRRFRECDFQSLLWNATASCPPRLQPATKLNVTSKNTVRMETTVRKANSEPTKTFSHSQSHVDFSTLTPKN